MEMLASRNQLIDSMMNESLKLDAYLFERSEELCTKISDEDIYKNEKSDESETRETVLKHCISHVGDRLDPTDSGYSNSVENNLLLKYGFENIRKAVDQRYVEFFENISQQIDEYLKGLSPEQQSKTTARNLKGWSSKIREAPNLASKEMAFRRCMRYYIFERGV